ncbi:hypothetical protein MYX82_03430 [Acidobacteria bacterium AH-259-D05]|nr:hypothetical protein [Acidobacteria bacterium AH-259-D05]
MEVHREKASLENYILAGRIASELAVDTASTTDVDFLFEPTSGKEGSMVTIISAKAAPQPTTHEVLHLELPSRYPKRSDPFRRVVNILEESRKLEESWKGWDREYLLQPDTPFGQLEKLRKTQFQYLIVFIRNLPELPFSKELSARVESLLGIVEEEDPELPETVSVDSLRNLIEFLQEYPTLDEPSVFLTPSGNFRAKWRSSPQNHFAVEFLPSGSTHYVLFAPDLKHPDRVARMTGTTSMDSLLESVEAYHVQDWITQQ